MDASYLSFLRTNDFCCVFRYYYDVNTNTVIQILNKADNDIFYDLFTVYLKSIDHLNLKLFIFCRHTVSSVVPRVRHCAISAILPLMSLNMYPVQA